MTSGGAQPPASPRKQDAATFSDKLPSTKHGLTSHASACPSFRIYYYNGAAGSIPFEWESHPGTPKHPSSELPPPPPLTPPPSRFSSSGGDQIRRGSKKPMKRIHSLIHTMRFWLPGGGRNNKNKVKKLSASSPSASERALIGDNEFKFRRKKKVTSRCSSFDSSIDLYPMRRSRATSCFETRRFFIW